MIRAAILCPDSDLCERLERSLSESQGLYLARRLNYYPSESEWTHFLQANAPELLFVSLESPERALEIARLATNLADHLEIVAIDRQKNEEILLSLMKAGVRNVLRAPFEPALVARTVEEAAKRVAGQRSAASGGNICSFLPSKPGSGASILALNTGFALVRATQAPTLLMDFDLNLGVVATLLGLPPATTVLEAATHASETDDTRWIRRMAVRDGLHLLPSASSDATTRVEIAQVRHLLDFARRSYANTCVDMSGNMETYSIEVLRESQRIVLVTSLDPLAAHLAVKKMLLLSRLELTDRVLIVATRATERGWLPVSQLEKLIGREVDLVVPHDRSAVREAVEAHRPVKPKSRVGKDAAEIARRFLDRRGPRPVSRWKRAFLDYFSTATPE